MRGPKPLPTWRKRLAGNPGRRPLNPAEPEPPAQESWDDPPPEVRAFPRAAEEWRRLVPMLKRGQQITDADRGALIALCVEWARYLDAVSKVAASSLLVMTSSGYPMPNPYIAIATKALSGCTKLWAELGLTPSSRSRVQVPPSEADPFAEFDVPVPLGPEKPTSH